MRAMDGLNASSPAPATGRGVPPETGILHKLRRPPMAEENTISAPSGVQAGVPPVLRKVSCLGSPPEMPITNKSPRLPPALPRTNATFMPSGEKAGSQSISCSGGDVNGRTVESARESKLIRARTPSPAGSENNRDFPSGDQSRRLHSVRMLSGPG